MSASPDPSRRIRLFAHQDDEPSTRLIFKGPASEIIQDLPGPHTDAERCAHINLILKQRAEIIQDVGYKQMLAQIEILQEVADFGNWRRAQDAAQKLKVEQDRRRREVIDRHAALEQEVLGRVALPPRPLGICVIPMKGRRPGPRNLLTEDDLYLDNACPTWINRPSIEHTCNLCHNLKSHPVLYACGHSNCYVCICVALELDWGCPSCHQDITGRPVPHDDEEAAIVVDYPGWDLSAVDYSWDGLTFPRAHSFARYASTAAHSSH
ncbi:hypothetical protein B0H13DRAFT_2333068 [Mycena leptocephala]|nr:hypothetical protein B0H13DRAFT_2333068 [Mycena leptocephala]